MDFAQLSKPSLEFFLREWVACRRLYVEAAAPLIAGQFADIKRITDAYERYQVVEEELFKFLTGEYSAMVEK